MPPRTSASAAGRLAVEADLDLVVDGHPVAVRGDGGRLTVAVADRATAFQLFRANRPGRRLVRAVTDTLEQFGVDVVVTVGGRAVLAAGPSAQAGRLARAVGLDAVEVTPPAGAVWGAVALALAGGLVLGARR